MGNKITLKNIADEMGFSTSTVSKALRKSNDISLQTQNSVKKVANKLGYRPNLLAQSLINKRSNILGIIIPDLRISFFSEATRGIYEQATKRGFESILMIHDEKSEIEKKKLEFLSDIHVDGILLNAVGGNSNYELYQNLQNEGIKIVCWDRKLDDLEFNSVIIDDRKAAFDLTSNFINQGRNNIMFVGPNTGIAVARPRYQGYVDALEANNLPIKKELVLETARTFESAHNDFLKVIDSGLEIDAIVCVGGLIAYGAGNAILESGRKIPEDILLGEFGDNDRIARLGVSFYTVNQSPYELGIEAVNLLVNCIENENQCQMGKDIIVEHKIIHREIGIQDYYSKKS